MGSTENPFIVFEDADINSAAETAANAGLYNNGQSCDSGTRVLVHEAVEAPFLETYLDAVTDRTVGDPLNGADQGPLCHRAHWESVTEYIDLGRGEGADLLTGGGRPENAPGMGYFIELTVFGDVDRDMQVIQEEVFGPVQFVTTFASYEEAIELANDTDYGLAAGVFTQDVARAHRAADEIRAGSVWVNHYFGTVPGTPFGGFKQSGIGRECAEEALDEYTQSKSVRIDLGADQ